MKILAIVSYKGSNYLGWQKQPKGKTIQQTIEKVLTKLLDTETFVQGSGRTDAGVHALGQTFHFEVNKDIDLDKFRYSMNCLLPKDIHIVSLKEVSQSFHARFSAKAKIYQYNIQMGENNPFNNEIIYNYLGSFDVERFEKALKMFIGIHNFQDFTSKEEDEEKFKREIFDISVLKVNDALLTITLKGNGFMRYMIRFIIGTCIAVGEHRIDYSFIKDHLQDDKNREIVNYKAPAEGLFLQEVEY